MSQLEKIKTLKEEYKNKLRQAFDEGDLETIDKTMKDLENLLKIERLLK